MTLIILLALFVLAVIALIAWAPRHVLQKKQARFSNRPRLSGDLFYQEFYQSTGLPKLHVLKARDEMATALGIQEEVLRPSDRFLVELAGEKDWEYFDESADDLFFINKDREKRLGIVIDLTKMVTLDDYIRAVCRAEKAAHSDTPSN